MIKLNDCLFLFVIDIITSTFKKRCKEVLL